MVYFDGPLNILLILSTVGLQFYHASGGCRAGVQVLGERPEYRPLVLGQMNAVW